MSKSPLNSVLPRAAHWASVCVLGLASGAGQAALHERGFGMVYDDVLRITWLSNANQAAGSAYDDGMSSTDGDMTWLQAMAWASDLHHAGFGDWRLPSAHNCTTCDTTLCFSYCAGSELGHMYFVNLQASADQGILAGANTANLALFTNLQPAGTGSYWTNTQLPSSGCDVFVMVMFPWSGYQTSAFSHDSCGNTRNFGQAWAVRNGDVLVLPEAGTFALGLAGSAFLGLLVRRRARAAARPLPAVAQRRPWARRGARASRPPAAT